MACGVYGRGTVIQAIKIIVHIVRSMYRAGSLRTVAEEISKYKLDLVGGEEVTWARGSTEPAGEYTFFHGKGMRIMN
jgi:hypothetical protein